MSAIKSLGAQLSEKLAEMEFICAAFGYEVTPTLLLRHERGPSFSLVLGNDDLNKVVLCIAELGGIGEVVEDEPLPPQPKSWRSVATWPDTIRVGNVVGKNDSEDTHDSQEAAQAVCDLLKKHGFGGDGKVFPISTRVEPVYETVEP